MSERKGPGGMKTESRSPIITSGVATPKYASNNIMTVIAIAAMKPASKPAAITFVRLIASRAYKLRAARKSNCVLSLHADATAISFLARHFLSSCSCKDFPDSFHHHCGRYLLHTGMIEGALAQTAIIARRARQIDAHNRLRPSVWADVNGIRWPEDAHHRFAERRGDMHRAGVVSHAKLRTLDEGSQIGGGRFARKIARAGRGGGNLPASRLVADRACERHREAAAQQLAGNPRETFNRPMFGLPYGTWHEGDERPGGGHTALVEEPLHLRHGFRREMDCEIRRAAVEAEHRRDPEVAIDCVHIERRDGNAVRICHPRAFPRASPAVARYVREVMFSRNCESGFDRSIKSDAHPSSADEGEKRRTHLAVQIDDEVVFGAANLLEQIEKRANRLPSTTTSRKVTTRKKHDVR